MLINEARHCDELRDGWPDFDLWGGGDFSVLRHGIQTGSEVRTAFYSKDTEDAFRDIKKLEREADPHTCIQYLGLICAGFLPSFHGGGGGWRRSRRGTNLSLPSK